MIGYSLAKPSEDNRQSHSRSHVDCDTQIYTHLLWSSYLLTPVYSLKQKRYTVYRTLTYFHFLVTVVRMLVTNTSVTSARHSNSICLYIFHDTKLIVFFFKKKTSTTYLWLAIQDCKQQKTMGKISRVLSKVIGLDTNMFNYPNKLRL